MPHPLEVNLLPSSRRIECQVEPATFDSKAGTVDLVVYTEGARKHIDPFFGEPFFLEFSLEPGEADLSRFESGRAALLTDHENEVRSIVGVLSSPRIRLNSEARRQLVVTARISRRASLEELRQDIADGIVTNVSIGAEIFQLRDVTTADDREPVLRAIKWTALEASLVGAGVDPEAATLSRGNPNPRPVPIPVEANPAMSDQPKPTEGTPQPGTPSPAQQFSAPPTAPGATNQPPAAPPSAPAPASPPAAAPAVGEVQLATEIRRQERERFSTIADVCSKLGLPADVTARFQASEHSIDDVRRMAIDEAATRADLSTGRVGSGPVAVTLGEEAHTKVREAVRLALEDRMGVRDVKHTEASSAFRPMPLQLLGAKLLESRGEDVSGLWGQRLASRILGFALGGHSSSDFPLLLGDVANKTLRQAYEATERTFTGFARRASARDFKPVRRLQLGEAPDLLLKAEGATYEYGTVGEAGESVVLSTYGRIVRFEEEALVNDDLDAFARVSQQMGAAAADLQSDQFWALFTNNVVMADGDPLFDAAHNNVGSGVLSADGTGIASLGAGRNVMRQQTGISGRRINVVPAHLIVPSALETNAMRLTTMITPGAAADTNPFVGAFRSVIVEPRLDADSTIIWYMAADSGRIDTFEYFFLDGEDGPFLDQRPGWQADGIEFKVRQRFAALAVDFRGVYRSTGA